ncbi:hypothetical protein H0H81_003428 [Sphagnurus paluster]|uniref:Uncharacterized protein n=1 Tax=Sphagnurus paluster TaxID=117069 RepID=A0A9P7K2F3_9AGAR|nr:hypothetical protein H0H81_003428 [Sphagnurus paluster]
MTNFLKQEQLCNECLTLALCDTKAQLTTAKAQIPKSKSRKMATSAAPELAQHKEAIKTAGQCFSLMHELFLPTNFAVVLRLPPANGATSNDKNRYLTSHTKMMGLNAKIYEVLPSTLYPWVQHSYFAGTVGVIWFFSM